MKGPRQNPPKIIGSQPGPSNPTAMLLLARPLAIDKTGLVKTLLEIHPDPCADMRMTSGEVGQGAPTLLAIAGHVIALLSIPAPLPDGWRPIAERSAHWPGAVGICAQHQAHWIVRVMANTPDVLTCARITTAVAGALAVAHGTDVLAGLWGAQVVNSAEFWAAQSQLAFQPYPNLPINLWVSMHLFRDAQTGGVGVVTQGLGRFVGRELELVGPAAELKALLERAHGLVTYLVQNGPILKDGSTFGGSETERISVRLRESQRFPGLAVIAGALRMEARQLKS